MLLLGRVYISKESIPESVNLLYDSVCELFLKEKGIESTRDKSTHYIVFCDLCELETSNLPKNAYMINIPRNDITRLIKATRHTKEDAKELLSLHTKTTLKIIKKIINGYAKSCYERLIAESDARLYLAQQAILESQAVNALEELKQDETDNKAATDVNCNRA